jgi:ABC-type glycerol-3-phosphate transport system substrate-binding protein
MWRASILAVVAVLFLAACGAPQVSVPEGSASDMPTVTVYKPPT